jgi:hypothetical protein
MTDTDKAKFTDALTLLGVAQGARPDAAVIPAYWMFLRDLELTAFLRACGVAGRTLKWFPKPSELRELALGSITGRAALAWEAVMGAIRKYSYTTSVDFGPLVNAVVRALGGWLWLDDKTTDELVWVRKDFERVFEDFALRAPEQLHGAPLLGQFGGPPVRIAIAGEAEPRGALTESGRLDIVRELADAKGVK